MTFEAFEDGAASLSERRKLAQNNIIKTFASLLAFLKSPVGLV
jgi:hypothetical protein